MSCNIVTSEWGDTAGLPLQSRPDGWIYVHRNLPFDGTQLPDDTQPTNRFCQGHVVRVSFGERRVTRCIAYHRAVDLPERIFLWVELTICAAIAPFFRRTTRARTIRRVITGNDELGRSRVVMDFARERPELRRTMAERSGGWQLSQVQLP